MSPHDQLLFSEAGEVAGKPLCPLNTRTPGCCALVLPLVGSVSAHLHAAVVALRNVSVDLATGFAFRAVSAGSGPLLVICTALSRRVHNTLRPWARVERIEPIRALHREISEGAPDHPRHDFRFPVTMGMFHNLMAKIFAHGPATATPPPASSTPPPAGEGTPASPAGAPSAAAPGAPSTAAAPVDVTAILDGLAAKNSEDLDWKRSIVDMLKLVGMDSSLSARKELADDLHYTGDKDDSASMNEWLHTEVLKKLAANGGKVPAELLG